MVLKHNIAIIIAFSSLLHLIINFAMYNLDRNVFIN